MRRPAGQGDHLDHDQPQAQRDRADLRLDHDHPRRQAPSRPSTSRPTASTRTGSSAGWSAVTSTTASPTARPHIGETLFFEVKDWTVRHPHVADRLVVKGSSFNVRRGEIVGFAGPHGRRSHRARDERLRPVLRQLVSGTIVKDGKEIELKTSQRRSSTASPTSLKTARRSGSTCSTRSSARSSRRS